MPSREEDLRTPDYSAAIAGARAWRVAPTLWAKMGGLLWSVAMTNVWPNREEKVAECEVGHPAPAPGCSCGVYAWCTPNLMHRHGYGPKDHETVAGVVAGRGRVIRGHMGYWVAERVVVLALFDDGFPSPRREASPGSGVYLATKAEVAEVYDIPVIKFEEYGDFCDEYGLVRHERG